MPMPARSSSGDTMAEAAGRESIVERPGYHSPQVEVAVRLNTNESPEAPSDGFMAELAEIARALKANRYPDREARALREAIGASHGLPADHVACGNGSNEVLLCLLLAYGGPGRTAVVFEPTYALHRHIAELSHTAVATGERGGGFEIELEPARRLLAEHRPGLVFCCSPNNPTGNSEDEEVLAGLAEAAAPGLLVVDEAYGHLSPSSATSLFAAHENVVVVRTFSKVWALAGLRLGYLLADPAVVAACERTSLPYHLGTFTQAAGLAALGHSGEMEARAARLVAERQRLAAALSSRAVESWPSAANFILFRPRHLGAKEVWEGLLARSVLVRDVSSFPRLEGCLRVTVGTREEDDAFLAALDEVLGGAR